MSNSTPTLALGPKAYSSWSLRPWLLLKHVGYPFTESVHPVNGAGSTPHPALSALSPSGLVPCLTTPLGDRVWDSLAIIEFVAEQPSLARPAWPADPRARALARCFAAEMHSGFSDLRSALPMNVKYALPAPPPLPPRAAAQVARVTALWAEARAAWGAPSGEGPFLFGAFCAADAMFAPVALRFRTYAIAPAQPAAAEYLAALLADPFVQEWVAAGLLEGGELVHEGYDAQVAAMGGVLVAPK